jgi:hypothetical protein
MGKISHFALRLELHDSLILASVVCDVLHKWGVSHFQPLIPSLKQRLNNEFEETADGNK